MKGAVAMNIKLWTWVAVVMQVVFLTWCDTVQDCYPPPPSGGGDGGTTVPQSWDPNEVSGALGFGDPATQRYVQPGEWLDYTIYFENLATATGAAQEVRVTSSLSPYLDWTSFETKEVAFNNQVDMGLAGRAKGQSEVPLNETEYRVRTEVAVDQASGVATWYLRIVDPTREDEWPADPYAGFLPPNDDSHCGEGYLSYRVKLRDDAPAGGRIDGSASIVFDHNPAIVTSPAWFNWIADSLDVAGDTGTLTWDAVAGATYVVNIWTGDPDPNAEKVEPVASSDELTANRWRLPPGLATDQMYYWQVTTTAAGGATIGPVWGFELGERVILDLQPGWNLVSLPFQPDEYSSRRLLRKQLFSLDAASAIYTRAQGIQTGAAYWYFRRQDESNCFDVFPQSSSRSLFDVVLNPDWNMVGPPEGGVTIAAGEATAVWEYVNGRYIRVQANADGSITLTPGIGYMIYK